MPLRLTLEVVPNGECRDRAIEAAVEAAHDVGGCCEYGWRGHREQWPDTVALHKEAHAAAFDAILATLADDELLRRDGTVVRAELALPDCTYPGGHLFVDNSRCFECGADQVPSNLYRLIPISDRAGS